MPCVGFKALFPASEQAKIVHALDRSPTITGQQLNTTEYKSSWQMYLAAHYNYLTHFLSFDMFYSKWEKHKFHNSHELYN
jgi:hypothetical protein